MNRQHEAAVRKALITICAEEPCANLNEVAALAWLRLTEVRKAVNAMEARKEVTVARSTADRRWQVNPVNSRGEPLVCGTWCHK